MMWERYIDPECPDAPRRGDPCDTDPVADRQHRCECFRCGTFALLLADDGGDAASPVSSEPSTDPIPPDHQ